MNLFLIRHGRSDEAAPGKSDSSRVLSAEGSAETEGVARRLVELGVTCEIIWTSPLPRAQQTAAILIQAGIAPTQVEEGNLAPGGDFAPLLRNIAAWRDAGRGDLALVGHLPEMAAWAERLVWGESHGAFTLKPGGLIGLRLPTTGKIEGGCEVFWSTSPRFLL